MGNTNIVETSAATTGKGIVDALILRRFWQVFAVCICLILLPAVLHAVTLEFWHPWPHVDQTVRYLAGQYQRQHGVTVRVRAFNPSSYRPWTGRSTPDLIGLSNPNKKTIEALAASGRAYNIQAYISRGWYSDFWPGLLDTFVIQRGGRTGIYGVPLTGQVHVFVYNRSLFRRAGISAPIRSWSGLMTASTRLRRIGAVPYAGGFGSSKPPLAHTYEKSYLGTHNLIRTYNGQLPYTSRDWVRQLGLYPEMRRYGFTTTQWASMSEATAAKHLINGRVAMVYMGPNFDTIRRSYRPGWTDWGTFAAPADARARFLPRSTGGVVEGLVINPRSSKKAQAARFAQWLTQHQQLIAFANATSSVPATTFASTSLRLRSGIRAFVVGMRDQGADLRVYERTAVLNTLYSGVRDMLRGRSSPSAVAARTQRVKRR